MCIRDSAAILHDDLGVLVAIHVAAGDAERERLQIAVAVEIHLHALAVAQRVLGKWVSRRFRHGGERQKDGQQEYAQCFHHHHLGFQTAGKGKKFQRQKKTRGRQRGRPRGVLTKWADCQNVEKARKPRKRPCHQGSLHGRK